MKFHQLAIASTLSILCAAALANKVALPGEPLVAGTAGSAVKTGKVTYVSLSQLPPAMRQQTASEMASMSKGYEVMADSTFERRETYRSLLQPEAGVRSNISVNISAVAGTELASYDYEGLIPDGPTKLGPWSSVIRVFKRPDGVPIFLSEWDYVSDGGAVVVVREMMNTKVGKYPARLILKRSENGAKLTELAWASSKKYYTISVWDDATQADTSAQHGKKWLTKLAESLD